MLNGFQKGPLIVTMMAAPNFVFAFTLSTLVKSSSFDFVFLSTLMLIMVDCFLVTLVMFGQMATINMKSKSVLQVMMWKKTNWLPVNLQKWEHKFYTSCQPLKIMIGSANFVDSFTPLNILQLSVTLAANILLLGGK